MFKDTFALYAAHLQYPVLQIDDFAIQYKKRINLPEILEVSCPKYSNNSKYWAVSVQDLHCVPLIQHYFRHINSKNDFFHILRQVWKGVKVSQYLG